MDPFEKKTPSLFLISTPFQALCALATIRQLEIKEYKIIAHLPKGVIRNAQLEAYLQKNNLSYVRFTPNRITKRLYRLLCLVRKTRGFKRLFIGNHNDVMGFYRAITEIVDGASIVYLDDGVQSISHFKGSLLERKTPKTIKFLNLIQNRRHLEMFRYYLSIYDGIENNDFIINKLELKYVIGKEHQGKPIKGVIIVGIVLKESCIIYNITEDNLTKKLENLIVDLQIKYPDEPIIYIPHGRDKSEYAQILCKKYNCEFRKCDTMIEIALMEDLYIPKAIYGYTSSALFSLKEIFPQTEIVNIVYESKRKNKIFQETESISNYYEEHGIKMIVEQV